MSRTILQQQIYYQSLYRSQEVGQNNMDNMSFVMKINKCNE